MPQTGLHRWAREAVRVDPEIARFVARLSVWMRWLVSLVVLAELAYRPGLWIPEDPEFLLLTFPLLAFNGFVHYRLHRGLEVTWRWLICLSGMDFVLLTGAVAVGAAFHHLAYVGYFPALAFFAAAFPSIGLSLALATVVAASYTFVTFTVSGVDFDVGQEKALLARVAAMYGVVACISLIVRFERARRRESAEREQGLHRDRLNLSQAIHDTAAQTAYMISMGIHRAMRLAGDSDQELASTLAATASLSRAAIWELRRPIDEGHLFDGRELGRVLWSHAQTFEEIASVPTKVIQTGVEPQLAVETRTRLFSIAHNALTNAFRHAEADQVEVRLDFRPDCIRLSVSDDGIGLHGDYAEQGRGFAGMRADAERLGGRLTVESNGPGEGTTVTCEAPYGSPPV